MARINSCLKHIFTIFNIFFMIVGGVAIILALWAQFFNIQEGHNLHTRSTQLFILYSLGCITMMISILGACGAHKESKGALIVFLVCMIFGFLLMLMIGISAAVTRPQLKDVIEKEFHKSVPLNKSTQEVRNRIEDVQKKFRCCGLFSYKDWEEIPTSCVCSREEVKKGECQSAGNSNLTLRKTFVYTKTCFPIIMDYTQPMNDIDLGVNFALAFLALLGMILSSIMIHQVSYPNRPIVMPSMMPPKYKGLYPAY